MISCKVKDKVFLSPLEGIRVKGSVGAQMDLFLEKRVLCDFAKYDIYEEATVAFEEQRDDATPLGYWRGEFWGKLAISAVRTYKYTDNESLREFLVENAHRVLKAARSNGYIGSYKNEDNVLAVDREIGRSLVGWDCDWNWNVWCRKYTLWGLLEIYEISKDEEILQGAVRLADHLIDQLKRLGLRLFEVGTFNGLPAGSIIKPMLILYTITEDKKYLEFCLDAVKDWEREDGKAPNLITNAKSGKPVHTWYPSPNSWAKAYEMLSCLDGLCLLYKITGDKKYFDTCSNIYDLLKKDELNVLFSVGFNDQFSNGAAHENSCTEACDIIHWMRLGSELYKLTGDVKYIDDMERAFYNAFLSSSFSDGTWAARIVRSSGRNEWATQMDMRYSHCCTNNIPRGYFNAAESFVSYADDEIFVNFYTDFTGEIPFNGKKVKIDIGGTYLQNGRVKISVESENGVKLNLRIPTFSASTVINIGGQKHSPNKSGYFPVETSGGKTQIEIAFEWKAEIRDFGGNVEEFPRNDFRYGRFADGKFKFDREHMIWNRRSTLLYGPLLYCRSKKCGNTAEEMFGSDKTVCGGGYTCELTPVNETPKPVRACFKATFKNKTDRFETLVCDFASGSNDYAGDSMELFSIWF